MNFKEQLQDQLQQIENEYKIMEILKNYYDKFFYLLLVIAAFYLGRFVVKNSLEQYLDYFQNLLQQQQKIKSKIEIFEKIKKFFKYCFYFAPIIFSSLFYLINKEDIQDRTLNFKKLFTAIVQEKLNQIMFFIFLGFFVLYSLIIFLIDKYIVWQQNKLKDIQGNKTVYVTKFFDYIGEDLKQQLRAFLIGDSKNQNVQKLYNQIQTEKQKLEKIQQVLQKQNFELDTHKNFIGQITSFEWCEQCYNIEKTDDSQSQSEVAKESKNGGECTQKCLEKYLKFCEEIAKEYFERLKKINQIPKIYLSKKLINTQKNMIYKNWIQTVAYELCNKKNTINGIQQNRKNA